MEQSNEANKNDPGLFDHNYQTQPKDKKQEQQPAKPKKTSRGPTCCVPGCSTQWRTGRGRFSMHKLPEDDKRCAAWLARIPRDWRANGIMLPLLQVNRSSTYVCSRHFVNKKSDDPKDVDYVPTIFNDCPWSHQKPGKKRKVSSVKLWPGAETISSGSSLVKTERPMYTPPKIINGRSCYVLGCSNGDRILTLWLNKVCPTHCVYQGGPGCDCPEPFALFPFPNKKMNKAGREQWKQMINRIDENGELLEPKPHHVVCSKHFVDGEPTAMYPAPQLDMEMKIVDPKDKRRIQFEETPRPGETGYIPWAKKPSNSTPARSPNKPSSKANELNRPQSKPASQLQESAAIVIKPVSQSITTAHNPNKPASQAIIASSQGNEPVHDISQPVTNSTCEQTHCFVPGCNRKRESGDNSKPRSFYRIPAIISSQGEEIEALSTRRRNAWVEAMGSKETILKSSRICSAHFVNGKPVGLFSEHDQDWVPSLHLPKGVARVKKRSNKVSTVQRWPSGKIYTPPKIGGGRCCYVVGCNSTDHKRLIWLNEICEQHGVYQGGPGCSCPEPYEIVPFPNRKMFLDIRNEWIRILNRPSKDNPNELQEPTNAMGVCTKHFVEGRPTPAHPFPEINIGPGTETLVESRVTISSASSIKRKLEPSSVHCAQAKEGPSSKRKLDPSTSVDIAQAKEETAAKKSKISNDVPNTTTNKTVNQVIVNEGKNTIITRRKNAYIIQKKEDQQSSIPAQSDLDKTSTDPVNDQDFVQAETRNEIWRGAHCLRICGIPVRYFVVRAAGQAVFCDVKEYARGAKSESVEKWQVIFLARDLMRLADCDPKNNARIHARFGREGMASKVRLTRNMPGAALVMNEWCYTVQGLFKLAFSHMPLRCQKYLLQSLTDVWLSTCDYPALHMDSHFTVTTPSTNPSVATILKRGAHGNSDPDNKLDKINVLEVLEREPVDDDVISPGVGPPVSLAKSIDKTKSGIANQIVGYVKNHNNSTLVNMNKAASTKMDVVKLDQSQQMVSINDKSGKTYKVLLAIGNQTALNRAKVRGTEVPQMVHVNSQSNSGNTNTPSSSNSNTHSNTEQKTNSTSSNLSNPVSTPLNTQTAADSSSDVTQEIADFENVIKLLIDLQNGNSSDEFLSKLDFLIAYASYLQNVPVDEDFFSNMFVDFRNFLSENQNTDYTNDFDIYSEKNKLLCFICQWLGSELQNIRQVISAKTEQFKKSHITNIDNMPPPEIVVRNIFPQCMVDLLSHWMDEDGLNEEDTKSSGTLDQTTDSNEIKLEANVSPNKLYPFIQIILEFTNNCLISGVAHVIYPRLLQSS